MDKKSEEGFIAIETLIAFVGFIMLTAVVSMLVNFAAVQLRVHYALTQTAKEVAVYCYALEKTGVVDALRKVGSYSEATKEEINGVIGNAFGIFDAFTDGSASVNAALSEGDLRSNYNGLKNSIESAKSNGSAAMDTFKSWGNDPEEFLKGLMWVGIGEVTDVALDSFLAYVVAPFFFEKYMDIENGKDALVYLKSMSVYANGYNDGDESVRFAEWTTSLDSIVSGLREDGLDGIGLVGSRFLSHGNADEISLQVAYAVNLDVLTILPKNMRKLDVVQEVKIKAWVGDGGHYE